MLQNLCVLGWASLVVLVAKNLPANAGDTKDVGLIPGSGRSPGEGNGNPIQCSCLETPLDRGARRATVHRVAQSRTSLKQLSTQACMGGKWESFGFLANAKTLALP